jgi:FkbM family methyltransferase
MPELFYDCGAYGLFTLDTERWQPDRRGKPGNWEDFQADPSAPLSDPTWYNLGPIVTALNGKLRIVDVGGYIGTFTIPLALIAERKGFRLQFDVFEPGPTRHALARNIEINGLADRVTLHDAAVSSVVGETTYRWRGNGAIGGQVFAVFDTTQRREVNSVTIDHICRNMAGPILIKLDTQGHEAAIMSAARETIAAKKALWQIEFVHRHVQDDYDPGKPFYRYIFEDFHVFEGGKQVSPGEIDSFMAATEKRQFRMTDLTLVPKDAPFTDVVVASLRR